MLVVWALVGMLAGCGGSDSEEGDSTQSARPSPPADRSDFVRRMDSLCEATRPELVRIQTALVQARDAARSGQVSAARTFRTFSMLLRQADSATQRYVSRLQGVSVPSAERAFYAKVVDSVEAGQTNLHQQVSAADAQDSLKLRELSLAGSRINAERRGLFAGHGGFRFCSQGAFG